MTRLMSIPEVLAVIPIKEVTLRKYVQLNKVDFVKIGRRVLFRPETIEALISLNTVKATRGIREE